MTDEQKQTEEIRARHAKIQNPDVLELLSILDNREKDLAEAREAAEKMRAKHAARIAGDSQTSRNSLLVELRFPWEGK